MGVLRGAFFIVGGTIGAGFITGAELVRFFGSDRFFLRLLLSMGLFFLLSFLFLRLGKKYGGFSGVLKLFRCGRLVQAAVLFSAFISSAGMLAGLDALLPSAAPILSLCGLLVSVFFVAKGMDGISKLNLFLVPLLLGFVFFYAGKGLVFFYPRGVALRWGWLLHAGMNAFLLFPVLTDAGMRMKKPLCSSALAALFVLTAGICILGSVYREGSSAINAELPFLYVARGKFFSVAVGLAILTSLVSSLYPLLTACDLLKSKKTAAKIFTLLAAFCLSRVGLKGIVSVLYPVIGGAGLFVSALCILYNYLFKKHHKEIHARGKDAENDGGAHHEIKFEHLPAVHDKVSESRP